MSRLGKFLHLSPRERRLLGEAALALAAIRLGLSLLTLRRLTNVLAYAIRRAPRRFGEDSSFTAHAARAVLRASAYVPGTTCLTQALALLALLQRRGCTADMRIGLTRDGSHCIDGHAWVEFQGRVIFGHGFVPEIVLPAFERE